MSEVVRVLRWYEKAPGERLLGEVIIPGAELHVLRRVFGVPPSDPMYDCWPVGPLQVAEVSAMAGFALDLERFCYFVEADAVED